MTGWNLPPGCTDRDVEDAMRAPSRPPSIEEVQAKYRRLGLCFGCRVERVGPGQDYCDACSARYAAQRARWAL